MLYFCIYSITMLKGKSGDSGKSLSLEELWRWFLRIVMGLVSFFMYEIYQDVKTMNSEILEIKIMLAETKKDFHYIHEKHEDFKNQIVSRIEKVERIKR